MSRVTRRGLFAFIALLVLLLAGFAYETGWFGGGATDNAAALPIGGPFSLIDQNGVTRQDADFRGKLMLVYFGYTYCPDICPATLLAMSQAIDKLVPEGDQVQPIFITVDPERDRGPALRQFTAAFDPRIIGLTGSTDQVAVAAKALHIDFSKVFAGNDDYVIDHSTTLSIIGPDRGMAESVALTEPYQIAAKLIDELAKGGVALGDVNNLRA
jgi:cytochrome oxidase Cu insertion factor (SCO1/SenC/PrrC family)